MLPVVGTLNYTNQPAFEDLLGYFGYAYLTYHRLFVPPVAGGGVGLDGVFHSRQAIAGVEVTQNVNQRPGLLAPLQGQNVAGRVVGQSVSSAPLPENAGQAGQASLYRYR